MADNPAFSSRSLTVWCGGVFAGVSMAQILSAAVWNHQYGTHIFWFPGAVLLGALLTNDLDRWAALSGAAYLGLFATGMAFGLPAGDTALVLAAALLLVPLAAWLLRQMPYALLKLDDFTRLAALVIVAVAALPALSAMLVEYAARFTTFRGSILSDWPNIAMAHSLGYVLYLPVWFSLRNPDAAVRQPGTLTVLFVVLMILGLCALGVLWYTLGDRPGLVPVMCLAPAPVVIFAIVRTQMSGSSVTIFLIALLAAHMSVHGYGPYIADTPPNSTLAVQLWSLLAALCALILSVVVEQRYSSRRALGRAHEDLRELAGRLIATQEQERARLARDLHDDINQRLAASSIGLSALRRQVVPALHGEVNHLRELLVSISEDVRQLSRQLHPSVLEHAGLRDALEALCHIPHRVNGPEIVLIADRGLDRLSHDIALCFYRVTQEAIANALRHAAATRLTIKASIDVEGASLWIFDNGRGFDPAEDEHARPGLGLISMNERAKLLGGRFELRSAPGKGVDLWMHIPLDPP
ncbi:sensor histidine kinase [Luteibacter aegosomaticola]|uniref:sensor histidine kinase n=1 Tax=Luteibacter aegosomaticola TaxID=2911538 RepID=UPI001FFC211A|nr:sensor histidine kinase [Luteibacter aegosomaticola]UPG91418.1 sensor histidine kinase [Luteibacter aegosomaticola]